MRPTRPWLLSVTVLVVGIACASPVDSEPTAVLSDAEDLPEGADDPAAEDEEPTTTFDAPPGAEGVEAVLVDTRLELRTPDGTTLGGYDLADTAGEFVHAAVRPGEHELSTAIALVRVDDADLGVTYQLRYLVVDADGGAELYWFPWRLQVHAELAAVADVAPTPVWSPTGDALAWVEWSPAGTTLRVVGWVDGDGTSDPSDEVASVPLDEVPAGTQLERWESGVPGRLTGSTRTGQEVIITLPGSTASTPGRIRPAGLMPTGT